MRNNLSPRPAKKRGRGLLLFLLLIILLLALFFLLREPVARHFFPLEYREQVEATAAEYGIDPWLVFAVIRVESAFDPSAESHAGARGLMQLLPGTAAWIVEMAGFEFSEEDVWRPEANIRLGCWYIDWLRDYYNGDMAASLAAYNAGMSNVNAWLAEGKWDGTLENLGGIPFAETRRYLSYVYESYDMYRYLYDK